MSKRIMGLLLTSFLMIATAHAAPLLINGAGATFPYPIYNNWFSTYHKKNPDVRINYQSIGSGGGIRQLSAGTVDFGASDAPMTAEEEKKAPTPILHVPTVIGAVVLSYNLDLKEPLKLDAASVVDIFSGKIKKWNDPALQKLNPKAKLPDRAITVVHRSDGSGTTSVFSDYLAKISPEWKKNVGEGKSLKWPTGMGAKGNEGVAGMIKQAPGTIGYIELVYALTNKMDVAHIKNKAGTFVAPSPEAASKAADGKVAEMVKNNYKVSITNPEGKDAYPIASFTWLLVPKKMPADQGQKLVGFIDWALGEEGQKMATDMKYAPLPPSLRSAVLKDVKNINLTKK